MPLTSYLVTNVPRVIDTQGSDRNGGRKSHRQASYRRAAEAGRAASQMRRAVVNWEWLDPQSDSELASAEEGEAKN